MVAADVWRYAQTISIDTTAAGANVPEDVENYPLAVLLDKSRFDFSQARADGADIRFFDAGGKALPHAIELWDRESGAAAIWVLLDVIKGNSRAQSIVMQWGRPGAPDISDSKAVFKRAGGFVGAWHLGEDGNTEPGGYRDSSDHEAHGTGVGMLPGSRVDARIGKGTHLDNPAGQNTARWIRVTGEKARQFNPATPITVSIWALGHSYPIRSYETMIAKGDTSWTLQRVQYGPGGGAQKIGGQGYQTCVRTPPTHLCAYNFAGQGLVTKEWLHFMVVLEEPGMKLYINGELNASESAGPWNKGDHDLGIGNQTQNLGGRRQWDGILDEARVMQVARSRSWAKLDYESQRPAPTLLTFGDVRTAQPAPAPVLVSVARIWDVGAHNAFTDLIRWRNRWYCTFREGDAHVGGDGRIRVLVSGDGVTWTSGALVGETGVDLRDPKLSITPDDRLMIVAGGSIYEGTRYVGRQPRVLFSPDGSTWSVPQRILSEGDWLWRVTWHEGRAYGVTYKTAVDAPAEWTATVVSSADGRVFDRLATFAVPGRPNETTLRFMPDGEMVALVRREAGNRLAWLGRSRGPYTTWTWRELPHQIGGPNFIRLSDGTLWASGRSYPGGPKTVVARLTLDARYEPVLTLPSGGDTSYAGMVWHEGLLWVSYYASHEGKTAIYLARVKLS